MEANHRVVEGIRLGNRDEQLSHAVTLHRYVSSWWLVPVESLCVKDLILDKKGSEGIWKKVLKDTEDLVYIKVFLLSHLKAWLEDVEIPVLLTENILYN